MTKYSDAERARIMEEARTNVEWGKQIARDLVERLQRVEIPDPLVRYRADAAESAAAGMLFFTSAQGIPVSTTHTITGGIVGVGASQRLAAVRWGVARRVVWAWVFTIPGAALMAAAAYAIISAF